MGWNHRVMRHLTDPSRPESGVWYAIHEAYYPNDATDDLTVGTLEVSYTEKPVEVVGGDLDELRWVLVKMLEALDMPVLDYMELSGGVASHGPIGAGLISEYSGRRLRRGGA